MAADVLVRSVRYRPAFYLGSVPIFAASLAVTLLAHWDNWDPALEALRLLGRPCRRRHPPHRSAGPLLSHRPTDPPPPHSHISRPGRTSLCETRPFSENASNNVCCCWMTGVCYISRWAAAGCALRC